MSMLRSSLRAAAAVACAALALPLAASAAQRPQRLSLVAPIGTHVVDRVLAQPLPLTRAERTSPGSTAAYATPDGQTVDVTFAPVYTPDPVVAQSYVNYLASLPHGSELSKLHVLITTPQDTQTRCGGIDGTLACYTAGNHTMTVPGQQIQSGDGVTTNYVIAHEYGHHIASLRNNAPFDALNYGPKYWSSYELVCNRAIEKKLFPGNERGDYLRNPGEGWADTYAHLMFPAVSWQFSKLLTPNADSSAAARKDVLTPWTTQLSKTFKGTFTPSSSNARRFSFQLTLDGAMSVKLSGPKASNYDLALLSGGKVEDRTHAAGSHDHIDYADGACRQRPFETITVSVTRHHGSGPFTAKVSYAG
jgi:hypothetical protein